MQALVTVHVKHGYICLGPMTDKKMCYMVMKALGFDWLKNHRSVIFFMSDQKQHKVSKFMQGIGLKIFD